MESKENSVAQEGHTVKAKQSLTGAGSGSQLSQQFACPRHPYLPSASDREEPVSTRRQAEGTGRGDRARPSCGSHPPAPHFTPYCPLLLPSDPTEGLSSSSLLHPEALRSGGQHRPDPMRRGGGQHHPDPMRSGGGQHRPDPTPGVILRRGLSCPCSAREKTQCWDQERGSQMTAVSSPGVCDPFHTRREHMHSERQQ